MPYRSHGRSPVQSPRVARKLDIASLCGLVPASAEKWMRDCNVRGKKVLLEWKTTKRADETRLKQRVEAAATLAGSPRHPPLHPLKCTTSLTIPSREYASIFKPQLLPKQRRPIPALASLLKPRPPNSPTQSCKATLPHGLTTAFNPKIPGREAII